MILQIKLFLLNGLTCFNIYISDYVLQRHELFLFQGLGLDDDLVNMVKDMLIKNLKILEAVKWVLIASGALLFLIGCGVVIWAKKTGVQSRNTKKDF